MTRNVLWLAVLLVGCGGGDGASSASASASAAPLTPFTGKLTKERILEAKDVVTLLETWETSLAKMEARLGKPTRVKGEEFGWAVSEGDTCTYVTIEKGPRSEYYKGEPGFIVNLAMTPMSVKKGDGPVMNYRECLEITGVEAGPPEDPNAAPPPADGSPMPVASFTDAAIKGRSKWKGQRVKLIGVLGGIQTNTTTAGDTKFVSHDARLLPIDKDEPTVTCTLTEKGDEPPKTPGPRALVVAEGKVKVSEYVTLGGDAGFNASLEECTLDFESAPALAKSAAAASGSAAPSAPAAPTAAPSAKPAK